uniref:Variant surface glycoprotein 1125.1715 n=1 Tax=Trypanosoma brucei TaxID=5691 RepID=A0A1J0R7L5_9TRYP|nr:variant surface glycoprotein 1125.1715 [Trypanosoma brucei]
MQSPVYALLVTLAVIKSAEAHDQAAEAITNLCKEDDYLQAATDHLSGLISPVTAAIAELKALQKAWQIAERQATTADSRCLYTALIAKATSEITEAETQLESDRSTINNARFLIERQRGILSAAYQASKFQIKDAAGGNDGNGKGGTAIDLKFETKVGDTEACAQTKAGTRPNYGNAIPAVTKLTKLKLTKVEDIHKLTQKDKNALTSMTSGCPQTSNLRTLNTALESCNVGATAAAVWTYTPATTHTSSAETHIFKDDADTTTCHSSLDNVDASKPLHEQLAQALCNALKVKPRIPNTLKTQTGETLANDDIVLLSVRNCNPKFQTIADITSADQTKGLKEFTKKLLRNARKLKKTFITSLQVTNAQTRMESKTESKKIEELVKPKSLAATISHLEGEQIKREVATAKKSTNTATDFKKVEEKCKDKPIEESKNEDFCEFKEGKYQVKMNTGT